MSLKVPDTERNRSWLGKLKASLGVTGYPVIKLMTVVETGTRALLGAVFGPPATSETDYARRLIPLLDADMLVLCDRASTRNPSSPSWPAPARSFWPGCANNRRLPMLARLDDGSQLSRLGDLTVRIITATSTVRCADATRYTANYRLAP